MHVLCVDTAFGKHRDLTWNTRFPHTSLVVLVYSYSQSILGRFPVFSPRAIKQQLRLLTLASTPGLSHYKKHSLTRCALLRGNANTPLVSRAWKNGEGWSCHDPDPKQHLFLMPVLNKTLKQINGRAWSNTSWA